MKNFLFSFLLFISSTYSIAQAVTIEDARRFYAESMKDKSVCESIYKKFEKITDSDNVLLRGYKGAVSVAMSKHLKTAKEKIAYFNAGKNLIEKAIIEDSKNVELKFIRFTIQSNCPPALKYNKNMVDDSKYIINNLSSVKNTIVRNKIKEYLLQSKDVSMVEKEKLNAL